MEGPVRTCLACRARRTKCALVRLVVDHDRAGSGTTVTPDPTAARPGRGAYVCASEQCLEALLAGGAKVVARALRADPTAVKVDGEALRRTVADRTTQDEETTATAAGRAPERSRAA